jgi:Flp pilus assembly pilin Flp
MGRWTRCSTLARFHDESAQDVAEYAIMLVVILVIIIGVVRMIGSNANSVFSQTASAIQ